MDRYEWAEFISFSAAYILGCIEYCPLLCCGPAGLLCIPEVGVPQHEEQVREDHQSVGSCLGAACHALMQGGVQTSTLKGPSFSCV